MISAVVFVEPVFSQVVGGTSVLCPSSFVSPHFGHGVPSRVHGDLGIHQVLRHHGGLRRRRDDDVSE